FVQPNVGEDLKPEEILEYCKDLAAYKRPIHVEIWPADEPFPTNRVGKVDVPAMIEKGKEVVEKLRAEGKWDR
ncbi:MAG TPA: long-chain fatty acid--CoA ligase, partial [Syntrophomonadaceae bacterium]|nr:long-chain fatty acid--CoA ligase [Syntrophomonadaceae bacterium]